MRAWIWIVLLLVISAIAGTAWMSPRGTPVETVAARQASIREYVEEEAKTRLPDVVRITMPLQGRIRPIELREGDLVEAGQVVAQLDPSDLETDLIERSNTVKRYEKNLQQIDLAIEQAEQTVKASQAKYDFAERLFGRTKALLNRSSTSQTELERDELQLTQSALDLRKEQLNRSMYEIMRGVVELMQASDQALQEKAERDRKRAEIRSPVAGVVLNAVESNERVMAAGELLLEIGDPKQLEVEADILTQDVGRVQVGNPVDIEGAAVGDTLVRGRVVQIYPQGFTKVSSLGVEQQRVKVIIQFDAGELDKLSENGIQLGVDYRVRIKIETAKREKTLVIPRISVFRSSQGGWQAFRVRDSVASLTDVGLGLSNDFSVEVVEGLEEGDLVIVAPDSSLVNGALVESTSNTAAAD